jgi:hypothetical protein
MDEITDESPQNIRTTEIKKRKIRKKLIKCVRVNKCGNTTPNY